MWSPFPVNRGQILGEVESGVTLARGPPVPKRADLDASPHDRRHSRSTAGSSRSSPSLNTHGPNPPVEVEIRVEDQRDDEAHLQKM